MHVSVQAVPQQNPCAHTLDVHWALAVQATPLARLRHTPPMHSKPATQSVAAVATVQLLRQALAPQVKGAQSAAVAVRQVPDPSQLRAGVPRPAAQAAGTQVVPDA